MGLLRRTSLEQLTGAPFTYAEVGATGDGELPAGYDHVERAHVVGSGRADFDRAAAAVFRWAAQRGAGLRVEAGGPASTPGTVVLMTAGLPRLGRAAQGQSGVLWPVAMTVPATLCHTVLRENANKASGRVAQIPRSRYLDGPDHEGSGGIRSRRSTCSAWPGPGRKTIERSRTTCCS